MVYESSNALCARCCIVSTCWRHRVRPFRALTGCTRRASRTDGTRIGVPISQPSWTLSALCCVSRRLTTWWTRSALCRRVSIVVAVTRFTHCTQCAFRKRSLRAHITRCAGIDIQVRPTQRACSAIHRANRCVSPSVAWLAQCLHVLVMIMVASRTLLAVVVHQFA